METLRRLLSYDPDTGILTWRDNRCKKIKDKIAGYIHHKGYRNLEVNGKHYSAHRLAWFHWYGSWPPDDMQIDHINGVKDDNRLTNLRLATQFQNQANRPHPVHGSVSGIKGVKIKPSGLIYSTIVRNNREHYLGVFKTVEDAKRAYDAASEILDGEFSPTKRHAS